MRSHDQHPDHQHRINRGTAEFGVVGRELSVDPRQIQHRTDLPKQVIVRNRFIEIKLVEQVSLTGVPEV